MHPLLFKNEKETMLIIDLKAIVALNIAEDFLNESVTIRFNKQNIPYFKSFCCVLGPKRHIKDMKSAHCLFMAQQTSLMWEDAPRNLDDEKRK